MNIAQFSKKNFTPSRSPPRHPQLLILALNQKSSCTILFASSNAFQNDMTWSDSAKNHGGERFQGKGLDAGQGLPCRDWEGVLPTQAVLNSNRVTSENFIQFCPSIQKLFMVFFNTDGHPDGRAHKLHTKWITPLPYTGTGEIFFIPHFFYLSQNRVSSLCSLTPFCLDKSRFRAGMTNPWFLFLQTSPH